MASETFKKKRWERRHVSEELTQSHGRELKAGRLVFHVALANAKSSSSMTCITGGENVVSNEKAVVQEQLLRQNGNEGRWETSLQLLLLLRGGGRWAGGKTCWRSQSPDEHRASRCATAEECSPFTVLNILRT